jgi:hypothetical protein
MVSLSVRPIHLEVWVRIAGSGVNLIIPPTTDASEIRSEMFFRKNREGRF